MCRSDSSHAAQETFTLELIDNPLTFSGRVKTSTFHFSALPPSVKLVASDNSTVLAELSNIREHSLNYTITVNKYAFDANKFQITLDDSLQEFQLEDDPFDAIINFEIEKAIKRDDPTTDTGSNSTAAGGAFILLILSGMLIFCTGWESRQQKAMRSGS
mgnify:CR=1 FL=1